MELGLDRANAVQALQKANGDLNMAAMSKFEEDPDLIEKAENEKEPKEKVPMENVPEKKTYAFQKRRGSKGKKKVLVIASELGEGDDDPAAPQINTDTPQGITMK